MNIGAASAAAAVPAVFRKLRREMRPGSLADRGLVVMCFCMFRYLPIYFKIAWVRERTCSFS